MTFKKVLTAGFLTFFASGALAATAPDSSFTQGLPENCRTLSKQVDANFDCAQRYFTVGGAPVNPKVVETLLTWISDRGNLVTAINLLSSQHSNQFFNGDSTITVTRSGEFFSVKMQAKPSKDDRGSPSWFMYDVKGKTQTGVFVIATSTSPSGTYDDGRLLLVRLDKATSLTEKGMDVTDVSLIKLNEFDGTPKEVKIDGNKVSWTNAKGAHTLDVE